MRLVGFARRLVGRVLCTATIAVLGRRRPFVAARRLGLGPRRWRRGLFVVVAATRQGKGGQGRKREDAKPSASAARGMSGAMRVDLTSLEDQSAPTRHRFQGAVLPEAVRFNTLVAT